MGQIPSRAARPQDQEEEDHAELLRPPRHAQHSTAPPRIRQGSFVTSHELPFWGRREGYHVLADPAIENVDRRQGRAELDEHAQGVNVAELDVTLHAEIDKEATLARLRQAFTVLPGMNVTLGQPISHRIDHMLPGTRANVAVKIFGPDLRELRRLGSRVRDAMAGVPGVADLQLEQQADVPQLRGTRAPGGSRAGRGRARPEHDLAGGRAAEDRGAGQRGRARPREHRGRDP